jgi:hypothetical protein
MVMLLESIGLYTCDALLCDYSFPYCISSVAVAKMILEEAKKNDLKLIIALLYLYHTIIVKYCDWWSDPNAYWWSDHDAYKLLFQMRDFGVELLLFRVLLIIMVVWNYLILGQAICEGDMCALLA